MASQIAHIIYAKKYLEKLEEGELNGNYSVEDRVLNAPLKLNKDEFILGCVFPDIRRIDESITRKDTHLKFFPLNLDFSGLTSFQAGWKFHLYCDMRREEILNRYNFYSINHTTDFANLPPKILEDELVYDEYNNWEKIYNYFNHPPKINLDVNVSEDTFNLWYAIVAKYLEKKPDESSRRIFLLKQPSLHNRIGQIIENIDILNKSGKVREILSKVKDEII